MVELEDHVQRAVQRVRQRDGVLRCHPRCLADGDEPATGQHLVAHLAEVLDQPRPHQPVPAVVDVGPPGRRRHVGQPGGLGDHVDDVHAEAVDPPVEPPPHRVEDLGPDRGVLPVQVRLLAGEQVQVVLAGVLVVLPRRAAEVGRPVAGLRDGSVRAWRPPDVPVPKGIRAGRPRPDEPLVLVRGVVDDEIHHQADAARVEPGDELVEVGKRPELGHDPAVVADVVAVVVVGGRVHRRQPHDVDAEVGEVVEVLDDAAQVPDPVAVAVGEAARVDLVDHRLLPPLRPGGMDRRVRHAPSLPRARPRWDRIGA